MNPRARQGPIQRTGWRSLAARGSCGGFLLLIVGQASSAPVAGAPQDYYYHADDLDSVTVVSDAAGAPVERCEYQDYGEPVLFDPAGVPRPASAIGNAWLFTGRRYEAECRLFYLRTRYLDPASGRFTSRDSIGAWADRLALGNAFSYVGNAPPRHRDPLGTGPADDIRARLKRLDDESFDERRKAWQELVTLFDTYKTFADRKAAYQTLEAEKSNMDNSLHVRRTLDHLQSELRLKYKEFAFANVSRTRDLVRLLEELADCIGREEFEEKLDEAVALVQGSYDLYEVLMRIELGAKVVIPGEKAGELRLVQGGQQVARRVRHELEKRNP